MRQKLLIALFIPLVVAAGMAPAREDLVLAIGGEPETGFDPMAGWGSYGNPLFQSTLLKRGPALETLPDLATAWQLSDDRRVWTITLRPDARFSDGSPVRAQDVAFTFRTAREAAGPLDLSVMEGAEAVDDRTLRLTLSRPWITFAEMFYSLGIVPEAGYGPGYGRAPVGSGPYRFVSWSEGGQLIVARNDDYYGKKPAFRQITFLFTGADGGLAAAQAGAAQMVAVPAQLAGAVPPGFHSVAARTVDNRGISLPFTPPREEAGRQIGNAVTADPAIRRAINLWLDRELIVDVALEGHGTPAFGPADGLPWGGEAPFARDGDGALALLDQAGWLPGPDGIRVKGGTRAAFAINYPASDATRQALAETVVELLRPLGIAAVAKGGSWQSIGRVMHAEPVVFGFGSHSPYQVYALYSGRLQGIEYLNPTFYANPEVDTLFDRAQAAQSLEASYPFWAEAAQHYGMAGDNAWAWLVNLDHVYLVDNCLDLGPLQVEPHGHGWPITAGIAEWRWTCE